ncbi:hypothetical protein Hanom_Chr14g01303281 [Helianthus anomalus]
MILDPSFVVGTKFSSPYLMGMGPLAMVHFFQQKDHENHYYLCHDPFLQFE